MNLREELTAYIPVNEQEACDRARILQLMDTQPDLYTRDNETCHLTASCWIVNRQRTKVLMAYHNIYKSWAWLGGHADGDTDLLAVALREAAEESGITSARPVTEHVFSVEILNVEGHEKRGKYVGSHLHLNVTYLLEADENDPLFAKPDENSGVRWFEPDEAIRAASEPWFAERIYPKLNQKAFASESKQA